MKENHLVIWAYTNGTETLHNDTFTFHCCDMLPVAYQNIAPEFSAEHEMKLF